MSLCPLATSADGALGDHAAPTPILSAPGPRQGSPERSALDGEVVSAYRAVCDKRYARLEGRVE